MGLKFSSKNTQMQQKRNDFYVVTMVTRPYLKKDKQKLSITYH